MFTSTRSGSLLRNLRSKISKREFISISLFPRKLALRSIGFGSGRGPESVQPEKADPQSPQLPLHLKNRVGEQIHQLGDAFSPVGLWLEPILAPHQVYGHDDADLRVDEHEDLGKEAEFGVGARIAEEKGGVEERGNEVDRKPEEVILVIELDESEKEKD